MDGILLESMEGLEQSPFLMDPGESWERLQAEKEEVSQELLEQGALCISDAVALLESEASEEYALSIRWKQRQQLEERLREINEAQDRLLDGGYGRCVDCSEEIAAPRLLAEPAAARCISCQKAVERIYETPNVFDIAG